MEILTLPVGIVLEIMFLTCIVQVDFAITGSHTSPDAALYQWAESGFNRGEIS
jgi:hypothetical protein